MEEEKLIQIHCGSDIFDIIKDDKYARCYLNKTAVLRVKASELNSFGPILGTLIVSACGPDTKIKIKKNPGYGNLLGDVLKTVSDSNQAKIMVLEEKPDETTDNKPPEYFVSASSLENYRDSLKTHYNCFEEVLSLSDVLSKTKLPKSALVFKDIEKVMAKTKLSLTELSANKESLEIATEHTGTRIGQVITALDKKVVCSNLKNTLNFSVNHIAADFMNMKRLLASLLVSHYPLYSMDNVFKKNTGYPATWFFDPSVFYNFTEQYKNASDNLIDMVREEASIVRPLYSWKSKVTGE